MIASELSAAIMFSLTKSKQERGGYSFHPYYPNVKVREIGKRLTCANCGVNHSTVQGIYPIDDVLHLMVYCMYCGERLQVWKKSSTMAKF